MMRFALSGLRVRLLLLVLLAVIPAFGLILYSAWEQRQMATVEVQENALRLVRIVSSDHERLVEAARQLLVALAQLPAVRGGNSAACSALFADLLEQYLHYANLGAIAPNGDLFCSALPFHAPVNLADRGYFRRAVERRDFAVGDYQIGRVTKRASVNFGYPVLDAAGEVRAVVFAALDLAWLSHVVTEARLPPGSSFTVIDRRGTVLVRQPDPEQWIGKSAPEASLVRIILATGEGVARAPGLDGLPLLFAFAPLYGARQAEYAYVSIGIPEAAAFAEVNRMLVRNLAGLGLVVVLAFGAAWVGGSLFVLRRVDALVKATKRLGAGDLSARTGLPYDRGELGQLARAFDETAEALTAREAERREAQEQLQRQREVLYQAEKLAAMGQLLAGVAHELNNPLAVVMGQIALLRRSVGEGPLTQRAEKIAQAAERCAHIVKNFLALARQHTPERSEVRLNQVVQEAVELLAYSLRVDNVEVTLDLAEGLPVLWGDPHQLHQVVVNLVTNAHHALRETPTPRRLTLTTRHEPARDLVTLAVADTGPGIPAELQGRIFEPFFTTKPPGQGTGLGLSLCQGIVEGHGGTIRVESAPERGAVFVTELPVQAPPEGEPDAAIAEAVPQVQGKRILVVDDEPEVADVLAEMLAADGHEVETAANGALALDRLRERACDLIVSDLRMPELDGPGLYRELERRHPELCGRVIFLTGDTLSPEITGFLERIGAPSLGKPFTLDEVRRVVQRALRLA